MSSSLTATLSLIAQQFSIYFGIPLLILGIFGSVLALIVMLSLRTFQQNSCAFYLIIMQFSNIGTLFAGLLSRIMITGFQIDLIDKISAICKLRAFFLQSFSQTSLTCLCLATIDQYLATSSHPSWQRWSHLKVAYRLTIIFSIIWTLHAILFLVYADVISYPQYGVSHCSTSSEFFLMYYHYVLIIVLVNILPIFVLITFGSLAYYNVRHLNYRTIPVVRQELDKQLTTMVLLQVLLIFLSLVPFMIANILLIIPQMSKDPLTTGYLQFFNSITEVLYYIYFAGSFYIYICVSERFRRQLAYVLSRVFLKQYVRAPLNHVQIVPYI